MARAPQQWEPRASTCHAQYFTVAFAKNITETRDRTAASGIIKINSIKSVKHITRLLCSFCSFRTETANGPSRDS